MELLKLDLIRPARVTGSKEMARSITGWCHLISADSWPPLEAMRKRLNAWIPSSHGPMRALISPMLSLATSQPWRLPGNMTTGALLIQHKILSDRFKMLCIRLDLVAWLVMTI